MRPPCAKLTQRGIRPTVLRLSDANETRVNAVMGGHLTRARGCLAVATFEGEDAGGGRRSRDMSTDAVFRRHGATARGEEPARSWERGRFASPALRDTLLDIGVLAETLETATTWANLERAQGGRDRRADREPERRRHEADRACATSRTCIPPARRCTSPSIAALTTDPAGQWGRAKDAASRAIGDAGGTITHHHAVGRDHRPYLEAEIGELGIAVLRAVKDTVDPRGIMNPGVLVAASPRRSEKAE